MARAWWGLDRLKCESSPDEAPGPLQVRDRTPSPIAWSDPHRKSLCLDPASSGQRGGLPGHYFGSWTGTAGSGGELGLVWPRGGEEGLFPQAQGARPGPVVFMSIPCLLPPSLPPHRGCAGRAGPHTLRSKSLLLGAHVSVGTLVLVGKISASRDWPAACEGAGGHPPPQMVGPEPAPHPALHLLPSGALAWSLDTTGPGSAIFPVIARTPARTPGEPHTLTRTHTLSRSHTCFLRIYSFL